MRRSEAKSADPATDTRSIGNRNSKSSPKPVLMASSSDLP